MPNHSFYFSVFMGFILSLSTLKAFSNTTSFDLPAAPMGQADKVIFTSEYSGKISGFSISMTRRLIQTDKESYVFESKASNFFSSIDEISQFALNSGKTQVQNYSYKRSIAGRKTTEYIDFNWPLLTAEYHRTDKPEDATKHGLEQGLLDPSLYQLFLQADAALNKTAFDYTFIKRKRIEHYTFEKINNETIKIAGKNHSAIVLKRKSSNKKKSTAVWVIPSLGYQIGKIVHINSKGSTYSLMLEHYSSDKEALSRFYQSLVVETPVPSDKK